MIVKHFLLIAIFCLLCTNGEDYILNFPQDFGWGSATAAYQIEGAWNLSGRGPSIWDTFSHQGKCNNDTGDVADDHYHRVEEDINLLKEIGVSWYRMSLSWSRIMPTGRLPVNKEGIAHYVDELKMLKLSGLKVMVTMYHWDLPQYLDTLYGGWLNRTSVSDFLLYAETCFEEFGPWVDMWATHNEPWVQSWIGYGVGSNAPGRCSDRKKCEIGNSDVEPYLAAHNILLSHAFAVDLYRRLYQNKFGGKIGIVLNLDWAEPLNPNSTADIEASNRYADFVLGWFADPIFKGDYPESMKKIVGNRLPTFTPDEKALLNGSWDYFGLNHYTSSYVINRTDENTTAIGWEFDTHVITSRERDGVPIGPRADSSWLYVVPWGIRKVLNLVKDRYGNPPLYITENGVSCPNESSIPLEEALNDTFRISYYGQYLSQVSLAITEDKVDIKAYFAWSLLDNFEWADGYSKRFGLVYVDYKNQQTRYKKSSANFYHSIITRNSDDIEDGGPYIIFAILPADRKSVV